MATRYWVGGSGTWDNSSTANWSSASALSFTASRSGNTLTTTGSPALVNGMTVWDQVNNNIGTITGGSGNTWTTSASGTLSSQPMLAATIGASVPTSADDVVFDSNSGPSNPSITIGAVVSCLNFTASSVDGSGVFLFTGNFRIQVSGNFTVNNTNIWITNQDGQFRCVEMIATTTGKTVQCVASNFTSISFNGTGGYWTLAANLSVDNLWLVRGTLDTSSANNYSISANRFEDSEYLGSYGTRALNLNASTINMSYALSNAIFYISNPSITVNAGTSEILFATNGSLELINCTVNKVAFATSSGSLSFNNATIARLEFNSATSKSFSWFGTATVNELVPNTTASNTLQITGLGSGSSAGAIQSPTNSIIFVNYFDIINFGAKPINTWYALNSTRSGTTTGWNFGLPSVGFMALLG